MFDNNTEQLNTEQLNTCQEILNRYDVIRQIPLLRLRKIRKARLLKLDDVEQQAILDWIMEIETTIVKRYLTLWRERTPEQWEHFALVCPDAREYVRLRHLRRDIRKIWDSTMPENIRFQRRKDEENTYERIGSPQDKS